MSDMWGPLPNAQQFPAVAPDGIAKLLDVIRRQQTQIDETRSSVLAAVAKIVADLTAKQAALDAQQATLTTTVSGLSAAQATLTTQQATLTTQQASLTSQLASINTLIGAQVAFGSVGASATGFTPSGTATDYAVSTITVPTGYSQAIVICTVDATALASASSQIYVSGVIAGTAGGQASDAGALTNSAAASAIRSFIGLSGGTISVAVRISGAGTGWNTSTTIANCNAIAVFLR